MICPHCGETLAAIGDAFCPYCRRSLHPADAVDDSVGPSGDSASARPVGVTAFCRRELAQAFRSRETILFDFYESLFEELAPSTMDEMNLDDFRAMYIARYIPEERRFPGCVNALERRLVVTSRCLAAWSLFWITIVPFLVALVGSAIPNSVTLTQRAVLFALVFVIFFPLGALAGLTLGNLIFGRPFTAIMNRLLQFDEADSRGP